MTRRLLTANIGAAKIALAASYRDAEVRIDHAEPETEGMTRQQRRALERAGAFVIESGPRIFGGFERFDRQAERTHPMNPRKSK